MEKFLKAAITVWNPLIEVRHRMVSGTLTIGSVLGPYIGIIIACNIFGIGIMQFYMESLGQAMRRATGMEEIPLHPFAENTYVLHLVLALTALVPLGAVSALPAGLFRPAGRSATGAAMLIIAATYSFYGNAVLVSISFIAGALAMVNMELALIGGWIFIILSFPIGIGIWGLILFFWFRTMLSVLKFNGVQVIIISLVAAFAETLLYGFLGIVTVFWILSSV